MILYRIAIDVSWVFNFFYVPLTIFLASSNSDIFANVVLSKKYLTGLPLNFPGHGI